jgi:hypothetical protein
MAPRYNVPAYASEPEHGSWGVLACVFPGQAVIATAPAHLGGGYPSIHQVEHVNFIRLTTAIFGYGNHSPLNLLVSEALKTRGNKNIHRIASFRLTSHKSNPKYHMVQEEVEHYDLMVNIRNLARVSLTSRAAGEVDKADEYRDASLELRDRALSHIDSVSHNHTKKYGGTRAQVLRSRLQAIRTKVHIDPFAAAALAPDIEEHY